MDKFNKKPDHFKALENKIKFYITEIITLKSINKEQDRVISKLRDENIRLKKESEQIKINATLPKN